MPSNATSVQTPPPVKKTPSRLTQPKITRYPVSGVLVLNKPLGLSSNGALQRVKYLLRAKKAGHTGALDPLATGVLPLCFGEATKYSQYLLDSEKAYESEFILGVATSSGDVDGDVIQESDASALTEQQVAATLEQFKGDIEQIPPMHSALKHQGQPLYKLARQSIEIERRPRSISIYQFDLLGFSPGKQARVRVYVRCSKGSYIRCLARDLGEALGVGGHVSALHRTAAGPFHAADMLSIPQIEEIVEQNQPFTPELALQLLRPVDAGIKHIPEVEVDDAAAAELRLGRKITLSEQVSKGPVRVMLRAAFIGIAEADGQVIQPKRLVVTPD